MPISYTGIREEHDAVRNVGGMFDVSHMGEFIVKGKEALDLIQWVTSNDVSKLNIGDVQYSCLPNKSGGIVDDLLVYRLQEDHCADGERSYMLVVNASNIEKDWDWIMANHHFDARMINISDQTGLIAVQGPAVFHLLQSLTDINLSEIPYYHFREGVFAGVENVIISATGYTGAGGFELYCGNENIGHLWDEVLRVGGSSGLIPVGLGARDTLRLEMGFCLYGNDIDDQTSPLEAGLGWITKLNKGDFIGKDWLMVQKTNGVQKKLCGIVVDDRRVPRHGYTVCDESEQEIGVITSGTQSPTLNIPIGMAYLPVSHSKIGQKIKINMGSKFIDAHVVNIPFLKK